jgi:hypothetical protein
MKHPVTLYTITCDSCNKNICDGTEFSCLDEQWLDCEMSDQDWLEHEGKHYCSNCCEWDENEENKIPKNQNK